MKPKDLAPHFILSSSPHAHSHASVSRIMLDVIIALLPTTAAGIWFFGMPAVWTIAVCISTCVAVEAMCRLAMKREGTIGDFSAVLTGLLLALNLPAGLPLWMAAVGSIFAITICKQVFGGLGKNPFNPALAARAFLLISFTGPMTTWLKPFWWKTPDAITTATPLASMKPMFEAVATSSATPRAAQGAIPELWDLLIGNMPGCIGEVSAIALILGGVYLILRKVYLGIYLLRLF
jgi:electron transport complex protein RnfD